MKVTKKLLPKRIRNGYFRPKPDNKAAIKRIRAGGKRKDQPFLTGIKSEKAKGLSKKDIKYSRKDFETVLSVILERKTALREACINKGLPPTPTVLSYAESNPGFRKKLLDT